MTDAVAAFQFNLPANIPRTALIQQQCPLNWSRVSQILLNFPPGCAGFVGVRVEYANNPVYPIGQGNFFILDSYLMPILVTNQREGGQWRLVGYNEDTYPHTVTGYFFFDYIIGVPSASQSGLISL